MSEAEREELRAHNIPVINAPIHSIQSNQGMVSHIKLEDGTEISCTGIFFKPELELGSDLPVALGCQISDTGIIEVDEFGKTSVPGVYAAGDETTHLHQSIVAADSGAKSAGAINNELNQEEWQKSNI